jgi:hypothetical protein
MSVLGVLGQNALDLTGVVYAFVTDDLDGHRCKISFDCCKRPTMTEAHPNLSAGGAHSDRYEHTEVFDARDEVLVEACVSAMFTSTSRVRGSSSTRVTGEAAVLRAMIMSRCSLCCRPGHLPGSKTRGRAEDGECKL